MSTVRFPPRTVIETVTIRHTAGDKPKAKWSITTEETVIENAVRRTDVRFAWADVLANSEAATFARSKMDEVAGSFEVCRADGSRWTCAITEIVNDGRVFSGQGVLAIGGIMWPSRMTHEIAAEQLAEAAEAVLMGCRGGIPDTQFSVVENSAMAKLRGAFADWHSLTPPEASTNE